MQSLRELLSIFKLCRNTWQRIMPTTMTAELPPQAKMDKLPASTCKRIIRFESELSFMATNWTGGTWSICYLSSRSIVWPSLPVDVFKPLSRLAKGLEGRAAFSRWPMKETHRRIQRALLPGQIIAVEKPRLSLWTNEKAFPSWSIPAEGYSFVQGTPVSYSAASMV